MRKTTRTILQGFLLASAMLLTLHEGARAQAAYPSAQAAADALVDALATGDRLGLQRVIGPQFMRYVPEHRINHEDIYVFLEAWSRSHSIQNSNERTAHLVVGESQWLFPSPIVKTARGWQFDLRAGQAEMQRRRIGRNELAAIDTLKTLCEAQQRYMQTVGQGRPAMRIVSRHGQRDGLYWPAPESDPSPLGADALVMEHGTPRNSALGGYHFRVLPGTVQGCAFAAWPARYRSDGVHSFVIGPDGIVRERDLGARTDASVLRLSAGGPYDGWSAIQAQ